MAWGKRFKTLREAKNYAADKGIRYAIFRIKGKGRVYKYWVGTHLEWLQT